MRPSNASISACDGHPAGFSRFWLQEVLRRRCGFSGAIFSDDLAMIGALGAGSPGLRARAAFAAGCDMALLCNDPAALDRLLAELGAPELAAGAGARLALLRARNAGAVGGARHAQACHRLDSLALAGWSAA